MLQQNDPMEYEEKKNYHIETIEKTVTNYLSQNWSEDSY